jgi:hypothetical protein
MDALAAPTEESGNISPMNSVPPEIRIAPSTVIRLLAGVVTVLVSLHVAVLVARFGFGRDHLMGMADLFDLNVEGNVPTWYSAVAFLACALALAAVAAVKHGEGAPFAAHWTGLALIFVYLSIDEGSRIHEHWAGIVESRLAWMRSAAVLGGAFRHLWVIPAAAVVVVVGVAYTRFLWHLPPQTRKRFVLAGALFVGAAIGLEMAGGRYLLLGGRQHPGYALLSTMEEVVEMGSILFFLDAVLRYFAETIGAVHIRLVNTSPPAPKSADMPL